MIQWLPTNLSVTMRERARSASAPNSKRRRWARRAGQSAVGNLVSSWTRRKRASSKASVGRGKRPLLTARVRKAHFPTHLGRVMTKIGLLAAAALFIGSGIASAQLPIQDLPDAANPTATPPTSDNPNTEKSDRPPAAAMPDVNAPDSATVGQAPAGSEKMQPETDRPGGAKSPAGSDKK
jgi:hypothetical protein